MSATMSWSDFFASGFATFQDDTTQDETDLSNAVLPLLRRDRFVHEQPVDFNAGFDMAMRLASRLLQSDALVPFIIALVERHFYVVDWTTGEGKLSSVKHVHELLRQGSNAHIIVHPKRGSKVANQITHTKVQTILDGMALMVQFELRGAGLGLCEPVFGPLTTTQAALFPSGCMSLITLHPGYITRLSNDTSSDSAIGNMLELSDTIIHELGHAICLAGAGDLDTEPFYKYDNFAECGLALQQQLFGGVIERQKLKTSIPMSEDESSIDATNGTVETIWVHFQAPASAFTEMWEPEVGNSIRVLADHAPYAAMSKVSSGWIRQLFTDKFWEQNADATLLRPMTSKPWLVRGFRTDQRFKFEFCHHEDESVPQEWRRWLEDNIRRQHQNEGRVEDWDDNADATADLRASDETSLLFASPEEKRWMEQLASTRERRAKIIATLIPVVLLAGFIAFISR